MSWKQTLATFMAGILRLAIQICFFIDGILVAVASIWLCCKLLYFTMNWLNRVLFSAPW